METLQVSKRRIKYLQSLKLKKNRQKYAAFLAEGRKVSQEFLKYNPQIIRGVYGSSDWFNQDQGSWSLSSAQFYQVSDKELAQISTLKTPDCVVLECRLIESEPPPEAQWVLYLDNISDPGNLGTIIRSADWFGVDVIYSSPRSVDHHNPKVVQATMGSLARMPIIRGVVNEVRDRYPQLPWLVADGAGIPIQRMELPTSGVLMIGSESHGIVSDLTDMSYTQVRIGGKGAKEVDSLNAGVAASILLQRLITY